MPASWRTFTQDARHCSSKPYSRSNSASVSPRMIARIVPNSPFTTILPSYSQKYNGRGDWLISGNPFDTMQGYCEYSDGNVVSLHDTWDDEARHLASLSAPSERNIFIHSYEDRALWNLPSPESWIGGSKSYFNVLIVRGL